jgi:hypothetical protein
MKIGVISDTHGLLRPEVAPAASSPACCSKSMFFPFDSASPRAVFPRRPVTPRPAIQGGVIYLMVTHLAPNLSFSG